MFLVAEHGKLGGKGVEREKSRMVQRLGGRGLLVQVIMHKNLSLRATGAMLSLRLHARPPIRHD